MFARLAFSMAAFVAFCPLVFAQRVAPRPMPRPLPGRGPAAPARLDWAQAEIIFVGRLAKAQAGPVGMSMPPLHTHTLTFEVARVLRGSLPASGQAVCSHAARQVEPPRFPQGKTCLVAAKNAQGRLQALIVEEADEQKIMDVQTLASLPLGWTYKSGTGAQALSPWAPLGPKAWSPQAAPKAASGLTCATTGRPALLAGEALTLRVEPVPPAKDIKWTNPDGDGEYKITVANASTQAVEVPALLSDAAGKVLWEQSLVILCQHKAYPCPGFAGVTGKVAATRLAPGASVSTVVNALRLDGPAWPQGGYRIEFQFCLGEKSLTKSFYFMTRHHGPIREKLHAAERKPK